MRFIGLSDIPTVLLTLTLLSQNVVLRSDLCSWADSRSRHDSLLWTCLDSVTETLHGVNITDTDRDPESDFCAFSLWLEEALGPDGKCRRVSHILITVGVVNWLGPSWMLGLLCSALGKAELSVLRKWREYISYLLLLNNYSSFALIWRPSCAFSLIQKWDFLCAEAVYHTQQRALAQHRSSRLIHRVTMAERPKLSKVLHFTSVDAENFVATSAARDLL